MKRRLSDAARAWKRRQYRIRRQALLLLDCIAARASKDAAYDARVRERLMALADVAIGLE